MPNRQIRCVSALAAVTLTAAPGATIAQDNALDEDASYLFLAPYYLSADEGRRRTADEGRGITGAYGDPLGDRWNIEYRVFMDQTTAAPADRRNFRKNGAGVDFRYDFSEDGFTPFMLIGTGLVRNDVVPSVNSDTTVFGNVGLGFVTGELGRSGLRLRAEYRYIHDEYEVANEGKKNDRIYALGLQIPLGRRIVERVVEVEREVEIEVERVVTETVPAQIVDSDNDGVPDQTDRCPGTLAGLATDNTGCASTETQIVRLDDVNFELDSANLTPGAIDSLAVVVASLRGEPNLRAEIAGHTDSTGSAEYNLDLSRRRAESVVNYLVGQGIARDRLVPRGYGETRPQADNETPAGRAMNRRVEFVVVN